MKNVVFIYMKIFKYGDCCELCIYRHEITCKHGEINDKVKDKSDNEDLKMMI